MRWTYCGYHHALFRDEAAKIDVNLIGSPLLGLGGGTRRCPVGALEEWLGVSQINSDHWLEAIG